jgi:hypothetical protein
MYNKFLTYQSAPPLQIQVGRSSRMGGEEKRDIPYMFPFVLSGF